MYQLCIIALNYSFGKSFRLTFALYRISILITRLPHLS